jgi:hypothetical protein
VECVIAGSALDGIGSTRRRAVGAWAAFCLCRLVSLVLTDHQAKCLVEGHLAELVGSREGIGLSFAKSRSGEEGCCKEFEKHDGY